MSRIRFRGTASRAVVAALCAAAFCATVLTQGAPASAGSQTVTYSATVTLPAQPTSNFSGASGGGDGWGVGLTSTKVYNIFHHLSYLAVNCHQQSDATTCAGYPKTVTDASSNSFSTSIAPGMYINQSNGRLYSPAVRNTDHVGGVICISTTTAAANPFCGFTALTPANGSPIFSTAGLSDPVQVGTNWYVFNEVVGAATGAQNKMLCFSLKTFSACPGQPYALNLGGAQYNGFSYSWPMGAAAKNLYVQVNSSTNKLTCFNTSTHATCSGSWPITISGTAGAPFPKLNGAGAVLGVCVPITGTPCYTPSGGASATPANLATVITQGYQYQGPAVTIGTRVYSPHSPSNSVQCYNFATSASCPNFPLAFSNLGLLYTVNADPYRSSCLWVNADNGADQIQNFDAYSAGTCANAPYRVLATSIVATPHACIPAKYTSLVVNSPAPAKYTSGAVDFQNSNGAPIPGFATHNLVNGATSLTDLNLSTNTALPQFLLTLTNPPQDLTSVTLTIKWSGHYEAECVTSANKVVGAKPPGPPTNVKPVVTTHSTSVTWIAPADDGHSPITEYLVTILSPSGAKVGTCVAKAPKLTCAASSSAALNTAAVYTAQVVAVNAVGHSTPGVGYSSPSVPSATTPGVGGPVKVTG